MRHGTRFKFLVAAAILAASLPGTAGQAPDDGRWIAELAGPEAIRLEVVTPDTLLRWLDPKSSRTAFLLEGTRPPGDRPPEETTVLGRRSGEGDWLLVESGFGRGAIWVTGLPAPPPQEPVRLTGRLVAEGGTLRSLEGIRFLADGDAQSEAVARPGDFVRYTLPGGMAGREPGLVARRLPIDSTRAEIEGDAAERAFDDRANVLVLRAVKPGVAKIRFLARVSGETAPRPMGEQTLRVVRSGPPQATPPEAPR